MAKAETAAELMARLQADPAFRQRQAEKAEKQLANAARFRANEAPLLNDFEKAGWRLESVWDLVNTSKPYPELVSILLSHLSRPYLDRVREGIARALAVPDAAGAWPMLRTEYEGSPVDSGFKDGLAVALAATSNENVISELAALAKNSDNGSSRVLLLRGLRRSRSSVAREVLAELKDDPVLAKEIGAWKRAKTKDPLSRPKR